MTYVLARANINLRGFPAGTVGWVNPSDPNIKMYVECQYIDLLPEGERRPKHLPAVFTSPVCSLDRPSPDLPFQRIKTGVDLNYSGADNLAH